MKCGSLRSRWALTLSMTDGSELPVTQPKSSP